MKIQQISVSLFLLFSGVVVAQQGSNGPMVQIPPQPDQLSTTTLLQQELESENVSRLRAEVAPSIHDNGDEAYGAELEEWLLTEPIAPEIEVSDARSSLEAQLATLEQVYQRTHDDGFLSDQVEEPEWEGVEFMLDRESTLRSMELAMLSQQIHAIQIELATIGSDQESWDQVVYLEIPSEDIEAVQWLLGAETGNPQ
ncbi:MAG: hypothetical protein NWR72_18635 [Bacteroidia bacterium]|nr:hypothetical protein [Bacteroidia bacterium]